MLFNKTSTPTPDTKYFFRKLKQRKTDSQIPIDDLLEGLLLPICIAHDRIDFKADTSFRREALLHEVKEAIPKRAGECNFQCRSLLSLSDTDMRHFANVTMDSRTGFLATSMVSLVTWLKCLSQCLKFIGHSW